MVGLPAFVVDGDNIEPGSVGVDGDVYVAVLIHELSLHCVELCLVVDLTLTVGSVVVDAEMIAAFFQGHAEC